MSLRAQRASRLLFELCPLSIPVISCTLLPSVPRCSAALPSIKWRCNRGVATSPVKHLRLSSTP